MISVEAARQIMTDRMPWGAIVSVPIAQSLHRVVARTVMAPYDFPLFTNSAMDGFCCRADDTRPATPAHPLPLAVVARIVAGDAPIRPLNAGEAARIMTGAMLPDGADTVIAQEEVASMSTDTVALSHPLHRGAHVRRQGEDVHRGDRVLEAGTMITPGVIGYLAALGISAVPIFAAPRVTILPTGSELVPPNAPPARGHVFECNAAALTAALRRMEIAPTVVPPIPDRPEILRAAIHAALETSDCTIIVGGISVGEKDYVRDILRAAGVETGFWQIAQKPGKPLFFGTHGRAPTRRIVFGLPGNPASSLTCFHEYVRPALRHWMGVPAPWPRNVAAQLTLPLEKKPGRTHFLRAHAAWDGHVLHVTPLVTQTSHGMGAFAHANCLAVIPAAITRMDAGDRVTIHWLEEGCL